MRNDADASKVQVKLSTQVIKDCIQADAPLWVALSFKPIILKSRLTDPLHLSGRGPVPDPADWARRLRGHTFEQFRCNHPFAEFVGWEYIESHRETGSGKTVFSMEVVRLAVPCHAIGTRGHEVL